MIVLDRQPVPPLDGQDLIHAQDLRHAHVLVRLVLTANAPALLRVRENLVHVLNQVHHIVIVPARLKVIILMPRKDQAQWQARKDPARSPAAILMLQNVRALPQVVILMRQNVQAVVPRPHLLVAQKKSLDHSLRICK